MVQVPSLSKVLVVWNNQKKAPPQGRHFSFLICVYTVIRHLQLRMIINYICFFYQFLVIISAFADENLAIISI